MSLQTRLAAFITAVGADIKSLTTTKKNISDKWHFFIPCFSHPSYLSSSSWGINTSLYGFINTGTASGWTAEWDMDTISAGTWNIDVVVLKSPNAGHTAYEYSADGGANWVAISANTDMYNATNLLAVVSVTGHVISTPGQLRFRARGLGTKNASSSSYTAGIYYATFRRTA